MEVSGQRNVTSLTRFRWSGRTSRLARKELRESLRDRRTLATLILMPLIVYPLLGVVIQRFALAQAGLNLPASIVVFDVSLSPAVRNLFEESADVSDGRDHRSDQNLVPVELAGTDLAESLVPGGRSTAAQPAVRFERYLQPEGTDLEHMVRTGVADVAVREIPPDYTNEGGADAVGRLEVIFRGHDSLSSRTADEAVRRIRNFRDDVVRSLLTRTEFGAEVMPRVVSAPLASNDRAESPLSAFVPLMLVLMTMTGAVYPAIDLTAGERERGTLEMLLAAPVPRSELLLGKFVAVFSVAVLTALINLTAMILTLYATGFDRVLVGENVSVMMFAQVLALLVVFASFFSAVLLSITSFARSFREAQAWLIPLMLISLAPGILSLMPGVRLSLMLAVLPLVNIVLLGKELFQGVASLPLFCVTLLATVSWAALALWTASRVFGNDALQFQSDEDASEASSSARSGNKPSRDAVPASHGYGLLVLLIPAFIILSGLRGRLTAPENLTGQLYLSGAIITLLFGMLPVAAARWKRVNLVSAFALRPVSRYSLMGAFLLGASCWVLIYECLLIGQGSRFWMEILNNPALQELAKRLTQETPLTIRLLTLAFVPAVCEEMFFRGYLMNALLGTKTHDGSFPRWKSAFVITSTSFAAFHIITDPSGTLGRLPGTLMLGLVLGALRLHTQSLLPGVILHAVNNGILLSLRDLEPVLTAIGFSVDAENQTHLPAMVLTIAAALTLTGMALIFGTKRQQRPH